MRKKLNSIELALIALHEIIRNECMHSKVKDIFTRLCTKSFCLSEGIKGLRSKSMDYRFFIRIAQKLYEMDKEERLVSSCYSIALTIFYIANILDLSPFFVVGIRKRDGKLQGHAWIEFPNGQIINPGNEDIKGMSISHKWSLKEGLDPWLAKTI
jgi:hypothetical protein